jgi:CRP/FNR family transcriptional regulator
MFAQEPAVVNVIEILQECRFFSAVQPAGFQRLVTMARLVKFKKSQMIFRQGDECAGMYIVGSGLVRVFKIAPSGKEHVLHLVGAGGTFAEVAAIAGFECPAHAQAVAPTTCVLLPMDRFRRALEEDHPLCLQIMIGLTMWVKHLVGLVEDVAMRDAIGRLARYLLQSDLDHKGLIELPSLKRHVASHLNLTSETFSRTIRRLEEAGIISEPASNHIQVLDRKRLAMLAEGRGGEEER